MANPYDAPNIVDAAEVTRSRPRWRWLLRLYPLGLFGSFFCVWILAWWSLGRQPRPSLDDPTSISNLVSLAYWIPGILLMGMPVGFIAGIGSEFAFGGNFLRRLLNALLLTLLWIAMIFALRSDPFFVITWYFD